MKQDIMQFKLINVLKETINENYGDLGDDDKIELNKTYS